MIRARQREEVERSFLAKFLQKKEEKKKKKLSPARERCRNTYGYEQTVQSLRYQHKKNHPKSKMHYEYLTQSASHQCKASYKPSQYNQLVHKRTPFVVADASGLACRERTSRD